jgi:hypothetical protein
MFSRTFYLIGTSMEINHTCSRFFACTPHARTWNAKVGKTSKTDATGIQVRPKKRRLSEADTSNEAIDDASETRSDIESDLEDDGASGDSSGWDDTVNELDSDDDAGDEGDKDSRIATRTMIMTSRRTSARATTL